MKKKIINVNHQKNSTSNLSKLTTNKGSWTEEEDKILISLVEKFGPEKWAYISSFLPERIGKQCRERWFNHLCPSVNKTSWSNEEEWILFLMHNELGNKWSKLCKFLPGRTDNTIKNHWNSTMRKKIEGFRNEFQCLIENKNDEEIKNIKKNIMIKYQEIVKKQNEKFNDEKIKNYEKFKNTDIENKLSLGKLKKILLFRTHSKKTKKRGRKRRINLNEINYKKKEENIKNLKTLKKNNINEIIVPSTIDSNDNNSNNKNNINSSKIEDKKFLTTPIKISNNIIINNNKSSSNSNNNIQIFSEKSQTINKINDTNLYVDKNSAFNKYLMPSIEISMPFSNIKTHLNFSSSIKKPIKIISEDNSFNKKVNNNDIIIYNNENMTPNKPVDIQKLDSEFLKSTFNRIYNSNNKDPVFLETPLRSAYKINNINLDKIFFSSINN